MATQRALKAVPESEFETKTIEIRGTEYVLSEVDGDTYDKCREVAIEGKTEAGVDIVNFDVLYRSLLEKSLYSPRLTLKEINSKPMRVRGALIDAMIEVVFGTQPKKDEDEGKAGSD